jgi:hypothetical protein
MVRPTNIFQTISPLCIENEKFPSVFYFFLFFYNVQSIILKQELTLIQSLNEMDYRGSDPLQPVVDDDFQESPLIQNGELMMLLARGVGLLVGIVAILSWFMIMVLFRAVLIWLMHICGVTGIIVLVTIAVAWAMRYGQMSGKIIYNMLLYSCN